MASRPRNLESGGWWISRSHETAKERPLLKPRLAPHEPPFTYTGVDFFGPFHVKRGRGTEKVYGCIFVCLTCRAINIEDVGSLESDAFIQALQRFYEHPWCRQGSLESQGSLFFSPVLIKICHSRPTPRHHWEISALKRCRMVLPTIFKVAFPPSRNPQHSAFMPKQRWPQWIWTYYSQSSPPGATRDVFTARGFPRQGPVFPQAMTKGSNSFKPPLGQMAVWTPTPAEGAQEVDPQTTQPGRQWPGPCCNRECPPRSLLARPSYKGVPWMAWFAQQRSKPRIQRCCVPSQSLSSGGVKLAMNVLTCLCILNTEPLKSFQDPNSLVDQERLFNWEPRDCAVSPCEQSLFLSVQKAIKEALFARCCSLDRKLIKEIRN